MVFASHCRISIRNKKLLIAILCNSFIRVYGATFIYTHGYFPMNMSCMTAISHHLPCCRGQEQFSSPHFMTLSRIFCGQCGGQTTGILAQGYNPKLMTKEDVNVSTSMPTTVSTRHINTTPNKGNFTTIGKRFIFNSSYSTTLSNITETWIPLRVYGMHYSTFMVLMVHFAWRATPNKRGNTGTDRIGMQTGNNTKLREFPVCNQWPNFSLII